MGVDMRDIEYKSEIFLLWENKILLGLMCACVRHRILIFVVVYTNFTLLLCFDEWLHNVYRAILSPLGKVNEFYFPW